MLDSLNIIQNQVLKEFFEIPKIIDTLNCTRHFQYIIPLRKIKLQIYCDNPRYSF